MAYRGSFGFGMALTPWVKNLLIANTAVFVIMMVLPMATQRAVMLELAFVPGWALMRPWTAITYMFVHGGFMHLFFNMLGLFFFGPALEQRWGSAQFLKFYFFCGIGGAAFSFLFASMNPVVGASAAVYGIMLAFALNWPDMPIYIWGILPVPAKYLVGILAVFSLMSALGGAGGNVAHFAHLGGFAFGFIYLRILERNRGAAKRDWDAKTGRGGGAGGKDGGALDGLRRMMTKSRMSVVRDDDATTGRRADPPPSAKPTATEARPDPRLLDELDRVLDKISTEGMSSLTPRERKLLDEVSRKYRQN
jgi:membrane associated rhomboid family serine protease